MFLTNLLLFKHFIVYNDNTLTFVNILMTSFLTKLAAKTSPFVLILLLLIVISGLINIGMSLLLGVIYALLIGNPFREKTQPASALILKVSIVVMGFGLNINEIIQTTQDSLVITILTITFALVVGLLIGKLLKVESKLSLLIAGGTAICGGSAIAAIAPAIQAKQSQLLISITIVFLLNAVGLFLYPELGRYFSLTQQEFGLWSALGIHDTSSVVGAAATYGEEALKIATTTKLARALWIIPLVLIAGFAFNNQQTSTKFPLFILFFIGASLLTSFVTIFSSAAAYAPLIAKKGMAISLFLIGAGFTKETLREIKLTALWQGIILWGLVSVFSFWMIKIL